MIIISLYPTILFFTAYSMGSSLVFLSHLIYQIYSDNPKENYLNQMWCLFVAIGVVATFSYARAGITDFIIALGFYLGILVITGIITIIPILSKE